MDVRVKAESEKRLIDANALMSYMDECSKESRFRVYYGYAVSFINDAPTIDAVSVVRCRECKHCDPENYHCDHPMGTAAPLKRKPDDFCSYGERMDGDSNAKAD